MRIGPFISLSVMMTCLDCHDMGFRLIQSLQHPSFMKRFLPLYWTLSPTSVRMSHSPHLYVPPKYLQSYIQAML